MRCEYAPAKGILPLAPTSLVLRACKRHALKAAVGARTYFPRTYFPRTLLVLYCSYLRQGRPPHDAPVQELSPACPVRRNKPLFSPYCQRDCTLIELNRAEA